MIEYVLLALKVTLTIAVFTAGMIACYKSIVGYGGKPLLSSIKQFFHDIRHYRDPENVLDRKTIRARHKYWKAEDETYSTFQSEQHIKWMLDDLETEADSYSRDASRYLQDGKENEAKTALEAEKGIRAKIETKKEKYLAVKKVADECRDTLDKMKAEINQMQETVDDMKAMSAIAEATETADTLKRKYI